MLTDAIEKYVGKVYSILESDGNNIKKAKGMKNCEESQTAEGDSLPVEDHTLAGMCHATMAATSTDSTGVTV